VIVGADDPGTAVRLAAATHYPAADPPRITEFKFVAIRSLSAAPAAVIFVQVGAWADWTAGG
jgi:hypothetical protein